MWMNIDDRQQPRHVPHGTSALPTADRKEASVLQSHAENSPAGTPPGLSGAVSVSTILLFIRHPLSRFQQPDPSNHGALSP
jgi:hypothetical protein